jgi:glucose/arabinose dehydrogenase
LGSGFVRLAAAIAGAVGFAGSASGAIAFVQVNSAVPQSSPGSVNVTFTAAQVAGDLNVVVVGWNDATAHVQTVTDSRGNTYLPAVGPTVLPGSLSQTLYFAANIGAAGAGSNVVTVTFDAPAAFPDIRIAEYSGIATSSPVDVVAGAVGTSASSSSGSVTTTNANDLLVGANIVTTSTSGPGTNFTSRIITNPDGDILMDRIVAATGSYNATAPLTSSGGWVMQMVAFRAAVAGDTQAPTAPGALSATAISSTQINLSWTASTDNLAVTGYHVERCQGAGCANFAEIATTTTAVAFNNTGLTPGTSYSYRVRANDAAGNLSGYSNTASTTTLADSQPPTAPGNLTATAASASQINLGWVASTDNFGVTGYRIERCQGTSCTNFVQVGTSATTNFSSTGLLARTVYRFRVRASDAANNLSAYSNAATARTTADSQPPTAPTNLAATAISGSEIDLNWSASTDNVRVAGYLVESCQGAACTNFAYVATTTTPTYADTSLIAGVSYRYRVRATDGTNLSGYSNTANATTLIPDTQPPTAPAGLVATPSSGTQINLTWTASTDDVGVTAYLVERCQGAACVNFAQTGTTAGTTTAYSDTGLAPGIGYSYRVRATDAAGHFSAYSNTSSATTTSSAGVFQNEVLISGMNLPTAVKWLPDGSMLVLELGGKIWKVNTTTWQVNPSPFLSLTNVGSVNGQQGLLDLVFDPNFATNHYYYVFYTLGTPNRDRASRFTATADLSGTVSGSEFVIYQDPQNANAEHHGGALNFGNDGKLYITTGEHFNPPDAQSLTNPRGKILRYNADGSVPTDNPFYDGAGPHVDAIWALGLRNPFRANFDALSGRLYIGDVGGNVWSTAREELNVGVAGANYGWPDCEGFSCGSDPTYTSPLYDYGHDSPTGLRDGAITGGFVYRGNQFPAQYYGSYFFADYSQNWIKRLSLDPADGHVTGVFNFEPADGAPDGPTGDIVQLCEGPDGALYYVDLGYSDTTGQVGVSKIRRIRYIPTNQPPTAVASATPTNGLPTLNVSFSSAGTFDPEGDTLTYSWTFGDGATSNLPNPVHPYVTKGQFTARLTVSDGNSSTLSSPITIRVGNAPIPTIALPIDGSFFRAGDTISFSGDAGDVEDGILPASAFSWSIDFLHEGHVHPALPQTGTKTGSFVIPTSGHDFHGNTRYRFTLTVTDSDGLQASQAVIIYPQKVNLALDSIPSGRTLTLDGLPLVTPIVYDTLAGFTHEVEATNQSTPQNLYTFTSWSDGGAQKHNYVVPTTNSSLVATYSVSANPLPTGLVAGYRFSEGSGSTTVDLSGNSNTGALVNGPTWTAGQYGGGLAFDGGNYVNLGNGATLQLTGSMTLTAWIKISANPADDGAIVAKLGNAGWQLKTSADTGPRTAAIQISSDGSDSIQRYSATALAVGTWYHVAGVYDAVSGALNIYVNGVLDSGVLSGTVPAAQFNAPFAVNIGQRTGLPGTFNFQGTIDEVHVFNRALTAVEIQTDMSVPR